MAEFLARRVFARPLPAIAVAAVAAGAVAGALAVAVGGNPGGTGSSPGGGAAVTTAPVIRTDLISTVQVGGSIGYNGSYTVAVPSGTSAAQVAQAQQAVSQDRQQLSADKQAESDASKTDWQAVAADQAKVRSDWSALTADETKKAKACAGAGSSTMACNQDTQQVSQDQATLTQDRQQLSAARSMAKLDHDQNHAKVASDEARLQGDQAALTSLQATALNPGTTYTWLPEPGAVIRQDRPVYALSDEPVPLLYGSIPAYRAFYLGMSGGSDVGELTRDLIALGYGEGLAQSNHYTAATAAAVERWQTALSLPATGQVLLGDVVFEPGPIRVTSVTPSVGSSVGGGGGGAGGGGGGAGSVLTATGTTPVVTIDLPVTQEYLVKRGDTVSVVLPDGTSTVNGRVRTVGSVATCPGGGGVGTAGNSGGTADQSPCSAGGSDSTPTVTVTISLDKAPPGAALDQAPVNVNVTTQRADNVLAVPVSALLALQSGGYGVQVVSGGATHLVGVTTGLYSNTLVQVSGPGIRAGLRVEVPLS